MTVSGYERQESRVRDRLLFVGIQQNAQAIREMTGTNPTCWSPK